jgi:hypothetical protein
MILLTKVSLAKRKSFIVGLMGVISVLNNIIRFHAKIVKNQYVLTYFSLVQGPSRFFSTFQSVPIYFNMVQYDSIWFNMVQHDSTWFNMIQHDST